MGPEKRLRTSTEGGSSSSSSSGSRAIPPNPGSGDQVCSSRGRSPTGKQTSAGAPGAPRPPSGGKTEVGKGEKTPESAGKNVIPVHGGKGPSSTSSGGASSSSSSSSSRSQQVWDHRNDPLPTAGNPQCSNKPNSAGFLLQAVIDDAEAQQLAHDAQQQPSASDNAQDLGALQEACRALLPTPKGRKGKGTKGQDRPPSVEGPR